MGQGFSVAIRLYCLMFPPPFGPAGMGEGACFVLAAVENHHTLMGREKSMWKSEPSASLWA